MTWATLDFHPTTRSPKRDAYHPRLLAYIAAKRRDDDGRRLFCARKAAAVLGLTYHTVQNELRQMQKRRPEQTVDRIEYADDGDYFVWLTPLGEQLAKEAA